jgi:G3E family GTPase
VALVNGCACCSVAGDLGEALDNIARAKVPPDYIVVEASGVADPARIAALARSPGLAPRATVVLADCEMVTSRADDKFVGRLVRRQLAGADLVVLNKIDLVGVEQLGAARALVARHAPIADVVEASHGLVAADLLLGAVGTPRPAFACDASDQDAATAYESHRWKTTEAVELPLLRDAIEALPATIVRAKGIVVAPEDKPAFEIHRVGARISVTPLANVRGSVTGAELVVIALAGTLDRNAVDRALNACLGGEARS